MSVMDEATDYVHTHVVNYEPTYVVLYDAASIVRNGEPYVITELADVIAESVNEHWRAMGLRADDVSDDVDYIAMIEFEAGE